MTNKARNFLISMGAIYLALVVLMFGFSSQFGQERNLKAFYVGYDKLTEMYSFEDIDENLIEFNKIKNKVLKKFDLKTSEFVGQAFKITYIIEVIEDEENEYYFGQATITKLELIELERNKDPDEEDPV